jgi:PPOX class probable F420-dependent enzyme
VPRLTDGEARRRFTAARVARLATVRPGGAPHVVPVTFAVQRDRVYTVVDAKPKTSASLQRLANIRAEPRVALLADHYADDWAALWWVRADGVATVSDDPGTLAEAVGLLRRRYAVYREQPPAGPVIVIDVQRWTGWSAVAGELT